MMFYIPVARENKSNYLDKCNIIERNCGLTRKVLRFGLEIPIVIGMIKRYRNKGEKLVFLKTLADLCDITYLLLDHP